MTQLLVIHNAKECATLISSIIHKETWQLCDNLILPMYRNKKGSVLLHNIIVCAFSALAHKREDLGEGLGLAL